MADLSSSNVDETQILQESSGNNDEETLQDIVLKHLQSSEAYHNYKIQITEEIMKILNNETITKKIQNKLLDSSLRTDDGVICLHLINDTLQKLGLSHTSIILEKELGGFSNLYSHKSQNEIEKIVNKLKTNLNENANKISNSNHSRNDDNPSISVSPSSPESLSQLSSLSIPKNSQASFSISLEEKPVMLQIVNSLLRQE